MSAKEALLQEIEKQPEPVLQEVLHYLKYLERRRLEEEWSDVLPGRAIEQEVLDMIDGDATQARSPVCRAAFQPETSPP